MHLQWVHLPFTMHINRMQCNTAQRTTAQQCNALSIYESCLPSHLEWYGVHVGRFCFLLCLSMCVLEFQLPAIVAVDPSQFASQKNPFEQKGMGNWKEWKWPAIMHRFHVIFSFLSLSSCLAFVHVCVCHFPIWQWSHFINALYPYPGQDKNTQCRCKCVCVCICFHFGKDSAMNFRFFFCRM